MRQYYFISISVRLELSRKLGILPRLVKKTFYSSYTPASPGSEFFLAEEELKNRAIQNNWIVFERTE